MKFKFLLVILFLFRLTNANGQDTLSDVTKMDTLQHYIHFTAGYKACNFNKMSPSNEAVYNLNPIHAMEAGMSLELGKFQLSADFTASEKQKRQITDYEQLTFQQNKIGISGGIVIHLQKRKIQYSSNLGAAYSIIRMGYQNATTQQPSTVPWISNLQSQSSYQNPYVLTNKSTMVLFEQKVKWIIRKKFILSANISVMQSLGENMWQDKDGLEDPSIPSMTSLNWFYGFTAGFRLPIRSVSIFN